jgi:hypothetical protein
MAQIVLTLALAGAVATVARKRFVRWHTITSCDATSTEEGIALEDGDDKF